MSTRTTAVLTGILFAALFVAANAMDHWPQTPTPQIKGEIVSTLLQADTASTYEQLARAWHALDGVSETMEQNHYRWDEMPITQERFLTVKLATGMQLVGVGAQLLRTPIAVRATVPIEIDADSTGLDTLYFADQTAEIITMMQYVMVHQKGLENGWKTMHVSLFPTVLIPSLRWEVRRVAAYYNAGDRENAERLGSDLRIAERELGVTADQVGLTDDGLYQVGNGYPPTR